METHYLEEVSDDLHIAADEKSEPVRLGETWKEDIVENQVGDGQMTHRALPAQR